MPVFEKGAYVTYGEKLSTVKFKDVNVNGKWSWKNPEEQVLTTSTYNAVAVFTPNQIEDYESYELTIELYVLQRKVNIDI